MNPRRQDSPLTFQFDHVIKRNSSNFKNAAMAYVLPRLETKKEVDGAIKNTEDKVLLLRFGREADSVCMQLDEIVSGPP